MKSDSVDVSKPLLGLLSRYYPMIRIWDNCHRTLLYESIRPKMQEASRPPLHLRNVTLTVMQDTLTATLPALFDGKLCLLELIRPSHTEVEEASLLRMRRLISTDPLTGLYNRRYIDEQLPQELARSPRQGEPVSFIYADIDLFKQINDLYGHIVGDMVLQKISLLFQQIADQHGGWAARYGGDEFLLCFPSRNQSAAARLAQSLHTAVTNAEFPMMSAPIHITCSFGLQTFTGSSETRSVEEVITLLDEKLYQAKRTGRNRIVL